MHILNDPSFFLINKTRAPQGEEQGLMNPLSESSCSCSLIIPSFRMKPIDTVLELRARLLESDRYEILLVEPEEDPASPRETLQESLRPLVRP
ncbi:hypothetical protein Tco_0398738 [Tanacetum coccineum]